MTDKLPIICFAILSLISCGPEKPTDKQTKADTDTFSGNTADTSAKKSLKQEPALPHYLIIGKSGQVEDTLWSAPGVLHPAKLINKPVTFPSGLAALQEKAPDTVTVICSNARIPWPSFKPSSEPSLFTKANTEKLFFFLTEIDSSRLYFDDCNYAMLRFLRYKTLLESLKTKNLSGTGKYVNIVSKNMVRWSKPLHASIIENNTRFDIGFSEWAEFWECGEKADYAPGYAMLSLPNSSFVKPDPYPENYDVEHMGGYLEHRYTSPIFLFSVMELKDSDASLADSLKTGNSRDATLITTDGKNIAGKGIDLNKDNKIDAFWYLEYLNGRGSDKDYPGWNVTMGWIVRLYLKIDGQWIPVWYRHCDFNS